MSFSKPERKLAKMPLTYADFARVHNITDRTLYRWRTHEDYPHVQRAIREAQAARDSSKPQTAAAKAEARANEDAIARRKGHKTQLQAEIEDAAAEAGLDGDAAAYEQLKATVYEQAMAGDKQARSDWMKYWGTTYADAEAKRMESNFPMLSDGDLISETLELIGVDHVRSWLEARK